MTRTAAGLPSGTRLTYDISLGVLTAQCPIEDVQEALLSKGRVSERERDLAAHVASALRRRFRRCRASHRASTPLPRRTLDRVRDVERSGGGQHMVCAPTGLRNRSGSLGKVRSTRNSRGHPTGAASSPRAARDSSVSRSSTRRTPGARKASNSCPCRPAAPPRPGEPVRHPGAPRRPRSRR